jgi:hypothetical protein
MTLSPDRFSHLSNRAPATPSDRRNVRHHPWTRFAIADEAIE